MATNGVVAAWWVSREHSRRSNVMVDGYDNVKSPMDGHTVEILPQEIRYAFGANQSPARKVRFVAADDFTPTISYVGGMPRKHTKTALGSTQCRTANQHYNGFGESDESLSRKFAAQAAMASGGVPSPSHAAISAWSSCAAATT